jgi:hypothetical protein
MIRASGANDDADLVHGDEALVASEEDKYCSLNDCPAANAPETEDSDDKYSILGIMEVISTLEFLMSGESDSSMTVAMTESFECPRRKFGVFLSRLIDS